MPWNPFWSARDLGSPRPPHRVASLFPDSADSPAEPSTATYHNRVSRILQNNCVECHREGWRASFSLETYDHVKDYAGMIRSVVDRQIMPPWFACAERKKRRRTTCPESAGPTTGLYPSRIGPTCWLGSRRAFRSVTRRTLRYHGRP